MKLFFSGSPTKSGLSSVSWTPFADRILNWCRLLTVVGVGFPVGKSLRFLLDPGCPTCINTGLLFTLSYIANLTSLLSSLRKILENFVLLVEERSCRASQSEDQLGGTRLVVIVTGSQRRLERRWLLAAAEQRLGGSWWTAPAKDVDRWKQDGPSLDDLPAGHEECFAKLP
ncbi:unnamed protein product [Prunus armeniaca]